MKTNLKIRALFIAIVITICFTALAGRVYWLQVVSAGELMEKAQSIWENSKSLIPMRGAVYDRNDKVLAQDAISYTVSVNPKLIHEKGLEDEVVEALAPILEMTDSDKKQKLYQIVTAKKDDGTFYVQREIRNEGWKIEKRKADKIKEIVEQNNLYGTIHLDESYKRYYPAEEIASHVLGYLNKEGEPVGGLEQKYDEELSGTPGQIQYEQDAKGYELPGSKVTYQPAQNGYSIRLTIDENIQLYLEEAMKTAYEKYQPISMSAIAVDPQTMEVLGMANYPNFNPNTYWDFESFSDFNNVGIMQAYEPGSTFKIIPLAAAVEEGVFDPEEKFQSGGIKVPGGQIRDHNWSGWGEITYLEGLKRSSNVAFVELGYNKLGKELLLDYYRRFGFGEITGIDLPNEAAGVVRINQPMEVATSTFGQGFSVTSIQQITALSAIANGGNLMKPYIVKEIVDPNTGEVIYENHPEVLRRVISEEAAKQTSLYLEEVISGEYGTGAGAYIDGYRIAGKTGTAQKVVDGKYSNEHYIVSFIGFAPVENPQIAVIVTADDPEIEGDYRLGSGVVTPVFKEIMLQSLRYLGISKTGAAAMTYEEEWLAEVPSMKGMTAGHAENLAVQHELETVQLGSGDTVLEQHPPAGTKVTKGSRVFLLTEDTDSIQVPDLKDYPLRDAVQVCALIDLECEVEGSGYVDSQNLQNREGVRKLKLTLSSVSNAAVETENEETVE